MRWIAASLLIVNILVLIAQLTLWGSPTASAPAAAPAPARSGEPSLRLLRELSPGAVQTMMESRERSRGPTANQSNDPLCTMVGPLEELLKAEYLVERLAALDVQAAIQELEVPGELGYWVYMPPRETRRQAFAELRELQAKGVDSYVIPRGELANGISFGMFSQEKLARNRMDDMRSQGYAVELKEVPRTYRETWVVIAPGQARHLDAVAWQQLLDDGGSLERRQNFCPPVASE